MSETTDRIERLRVAGRLTDDEARELLSHSEALEARRREAPSSVAGHAPWARFLRREIDASAFRGAIRRRLGVGALAFSTCFAVLFLPLYGMANPGAFDHLRGTRLLAVVMLFVLAGPLWAVAFHVTFIRPRITRLIRLVGQFDGPLVPLEGTKAGQCPTCGAEDAEASVGRLILLHWKLNPGIAVAELTSGLSVPRDTRRCRQCGMDFIDCHACDRSIDSRGKSRWWPWGNWRGLPCSHCGAPLPLVRNFITAAVLGPRRADQASDRPA